MSTTKQYAVYEPSQSFQPTLVPGDTPEEAAQNWVKANTTSHTSTTYTVLVTYLGGGPGLSLQGNVYNVRPRETRTIEYQTEFVEGI